MRQSNAKEGSTESGFLCKFAHYCYSQMKKCFLLALLFTGIAAFAGEPYFCTSGGRKLFYERYKAGTSKVIQTTELNVISVVKDGPERNVNYWMSVRKADGREILATPAGSFDCVVVREHRRENGPMHHNEIWTDTWYAPDIGYVRHDHFNKKLRLESSEILVREER